MLVYGLSGKSGTGKSYNAAELCGRMDIDAIIDDGIFIMEGEIAAGVSAKKSATKLGAVKQALFTDDAHCREVRESIRELMPEKILILGTSDEMVRKIAARLELPEPEEIIHIEDITTPEQRKEASKHRTDDGTHIIPAPTFQVKKQFSGYFVDPRKGFRENVPGTPRTERTIVRPTYSYLGNYAISDKVITDIVEKAAEGIKGIASVLWVACNNDDSGLYIRAIVLFDYDAAVYECALELQKRAANMVAYMTAFNVLGIDVEIHGFQQP
ncbi:MAG: hypothetical protein IKI65_06900 [Firmicutes bacterium]|nr:hypothetical protein [Bacillota bacterium]